MSINIILEEIKDTPSSIIPILSLLHNDKQILTNLTKPELNHLISRTLNLVRSPQPYNKWCGINLIRVLVTDYTILASEGNNLISSLLKVLESYNYTIDVKILTSCIDAIDVMSDLIRGKPTLTREILTPKLSSIIGYYFEYLHFAPHLVLTSLQKILKNHPTTFRPFGNKLSAKLVGLINSPEFVNVPGDLQVAMYDTLAMLPVIEKTEPETKWYGDVINILGEIGELVQVYQEFLNFKDDQELINSLKKLRKPSVKILSDISIDFNRPKSILKISDNVNILFGLLKSYLSVETPFSVKVPLGLVLTTCEVVCSINVKFLAFKGDIRDDTIKKLIQLSLVENYKSAISVLSTLTIFQGSLISHMSTIWSILETLIPYKNKRVVEKDVLDHESLYDDLLNCMVDYLSLLGYVSDNTQLLRFVDLALILIEPRIKNNNSNNDAQSKNSPNPSKKQPKKRKNTSATSYPMNISSWTKSQPVQSKPSDHSLIKLSLKYVIIESIHAKYYNLKHVVPKELKALLIDAVLYPGYDKISILPIVSSILGDDRLLSVFNNPRFPPLPKYINMSNQVDIDEEEDDEEEVVAVKSDSFSVESIENPFKKRKLEEEDTVVVEEPKVDDVEKPKVDDAEEVTKPELVVADPKEIEEIPVAVEPEVQIEDKIEVDDVVDDIKPVADIVPETKQEESEDDESSDFEMPEINLDQDSDDE
ncbi:RIX1 Pre-rRNA-processing protein RIX1 [Candida maltosa Xu316]